MDINVFLLSEYVRHNLVNEDSKPIREARIFEKVLELLPIDIKKPEILAGSPRGTWDSLEVSDDLKDCILAWHESVQPVPTVEMTPAEKLCDRFNCFGGYTTAHTTVDYPKVINKGLQGIIAELDINNEYHKAMQITLEALSGLAERYAELASAESESVKSEPEIDHLKLISQSCSRIATQPAENFHQALQAVWLTHVAVGISEFCTASLSLGRIDQYIYPFYKRDIENGISIESLEESLKDLFLKLNTYGDPACAVNLGGVDEHGNDLFNPLSEMILRVAKRLHKPSPIIAVHVHSGLEGRVIQDIVDPKLFAIGQPSFYGEFSCREALAKRGVPVDELHKWAVNSCMGLMMPGEEISDMWGSVVNMLLPLELAINSGNPLHREMPLSLKTQAPEDYRSFSQFFDTLMSYTDEILDFCIEQNKSGIRYYADERPNPFLSVLTGDCIARGLDRAAGGAKYHTVIVEAFGLINAADSLLAIEKLVFREQKFTLNQIREAILCNFKGYEEIHHQLLKIAKYGNGDSEADKMARHLAESFASSVEKYSSESIKYVPSFHTLNCHINAGAKMGASLDGRYAGDPLAKNIGTSPGNIKSGLTSLLLSAASVGQTSFAGGQALDISVDQSSIRTPEDRRKFMELLQTYFNLGGLQVQVNGLSVDELREAMLNPQSHSDLTVRIAGYSAYYVNLGREVQEEMIQRFECGV